ncbi:MAG: HAMP domain-containing histidine kinase, partial [Zoogloeaceae bacterium]|nr:HAMP domain-containing histidine kinase [Zoogloeaceae bacterium]
MRDKPDFPMLKKFFLWLFSFRLRMLFRSAFLFLALAVLALAVTVLQEEKERSYQNYREALQKTKEQITARLSHPSGQLALLNPTQWPEGAENLHPVLLPFSAIDFDDQNKVRHAMEIADCLVRFEKHGSLCVAVGNNPWIGGFIYAAGTFASGPLVPHAIGDQYLDGAHRLRASVYLRGRHYRWLAPFEILPPRRNAAEGVRGRFTGYVEEEGRDYTGKMPVKEFRGWVWQEAACLDPLRGGNLSTQTNCPTGDCRPQDPENCEKKSFFSLRLPVDELIADLLRDRSAPWPPPDLDTIHVRLEVLPPGEAAPLFDSDAFSATPPFSLQHLGALLQPGEILTIERESDQHELAVIQSREGLEERISPLLARLISRLPVSGTIMEESDDAAGEGGPVVLEDVVATPLGNYRITLSGAADRVVNQTLSITATRLAWFVGAIMMAIVLAWLVIEIGMVRRIARLTGRSRQLAPAREEEGFLSVDFSDLQGSDEMGILAACLNRLLSRVKEDAARERLRAAQEKEQWHAVGHEIMSPLQSLLALHGNPEDPSHRYLARMQQALRVLYGSASPSEAFQSSHLLVATLDLDRFLENVAANAPHIGIENVRYIPLGAPAPVYADEYSLEDVLGHLLKNAAEHREADTLITLSLTRTDSEHIRLDIHNTGPAIPPENLERIFEYGFSGKAAAGKAAAGNRGQGLFVAKTYMAKMGGTIRAFNEKDGVRFELT